MDIAECGATTPTGACSALRILQVSRWLTDGSGGGIQTYLTTLSSVLDSNSVVLKYAALMPGAQPEYLSTPARVGDAGLSKWGNGKALFRWLNKELCHFDVVHIHGATDWHFVFGAVACLRHGVPYLVRPAGGLFPEALSHTRRSRIAARWFLKLIGLRLLSKSFAVIAGSPREVELLEGLDPRIKVCMIPNGVSVPESQPLLPFLDTPPLRVLFLGRIEPIKGLPTLMRAIARIQTGKNYARLEIVGSGESEYVGELQRLSEHLDIADSVVWHGYKVGEEKLTLLRQSHLLVLPSLSESFGFVVAEAMAIGLPVVVSDGVGVAEEVRRYSAGAVFPVGDHLALADALLVYMDVAEIKACSEHAYRCVKNEFSVEAMGVNLLDIYRQAAGLAERVDGKCRSPTGRQD